MNKLRKIEAKTENVDHESDSDSDSDGDCQMSKMVKTKLYREILIKYENILKCYVKNQNDEKFEKIIKNIIFEYRVIQVFKKFNYNYINNFN